jgi:hypothetical protein
VIGKVSDRGRQQWAIAALEWSDGDDPAVAKVQQFGRLSDHAPVSGPST